MSENPDLQFDAQLTAVVLRFAEFHEGMRFAGFVELRPTQKTGKATTQPDEMVGIKSGQLHLLLGRNGAGKSRLLNALLTASESRSGFPSASLIFALPDPTAHDVTEKDIVEELARLPKPALMSDLLWSLEGPAPDDYVPELDDRAAESLRLFGFSESEITEWSQRSERREQVEYLGDEVESWYRIRGIGESTLQNLAAEFLLKGAKSLSPILGAVPRWLHRIVPGYVGPKTTWFDDPRRRALVAPAIREFLKLADHLEVMSAGRYRILAPRPDSGPLRMMLDEVAVSLASDDDAGGGRSLDEVFPVGLFSTMNLEGNPFVASFELTGIERGVVRSINISSGQRTADRLDDVIQSLFTELLRFHRTVDGEAPQFELIGLEKLRAVLKTAEVRLRNCEIAIDGLDLQWPSSESIPTLVFPRLVWLDAVSGAWLETSHASDGQLQVLTLFLELGLIEVRASRGAASHVVLVGDEFDRNLHPTAATAVLGVLADLLTEIPGATAIVSTHNVASASAPAIRSCERIIARRDASGFKYLKSMDSSIEAISDVLGVAALDALRLKRLHIVVEGTHDELVISDLLKNQVPELNDIEIVNARGLYGWSGLYANWLRHLDAPVLLVHDKRNQELEENWRLCQRQVEETGSLKPWERSWFESERGKAEYRSSRGEWRPGDGELLQVLYLLRDNIFRGDNLQAKRVHIFGLSCEDIVDLLPISEFENAARSYSCWEDAHREFRKKSPKGSSKKFKKDLDINEKTVRSALSNNQDHVVPELGRLLGEIRRLLDS